jgi:hypothetical protein
MAVLDTAEAHNILNALTGKAAYTATTGPLKMKLTTTVGTDAAAGTEVVNSGGSTYAAQTVGTTATNGWGTPASRQITNSGTNGAVSFTNMPAVGSPGVQGCEFYDQAGTPVRKAYGALGSAKIVAAGDTLSFAQSSITLGFS